MPGRIQHTFKHAALYQNSADPEIQARSTIAQGLQVFSLSFSPGDKYLAAGFGDGSVRIWRPSSFDRFATLNSRIPEPDEPKKPQLNPSLSRNELLTLDKNPTDSITCLKFRPSALSNDDLLAIADAGGCVTLWSTSASSGASAPGSTPSSASPSAAGRVVHRVRPDGFGGILALDWIFGSDRLAAGGVNREIRILDVETSSTVGSFIPSTDSQGKDTGHSNRISHISAHPGDSNLLISGGWDGAVILWDVRSPLPVASLGGFNLSGGSPVVWLPDGNHFAVFHEETLKIYDFNKTTDPVVMVVLAGKASDQASSMRVNSLDVAPDGSVHFAGSATGRAKATGRAGALEFAVDNVAGEAGREFWTVAAARRSQQAALGTPDGVVELINY